MMKISYSKYQNILFALFLLSGAIKFIFTFYKFPIDITFLLVILITGDIFFNSILKLKKLLFNTEQVFYILVFIAFYLLIIITLLYSKSNNYSFIKTINFSLNFLSFIYPAFMVKFNDKVFFKTFLVLIIPASIMFLIAKNIYWFGDNQELRNKYMFFGGSYLMLGDILVLGMFFLIKNRNYLFLFPLILLLLAMGAKGPFLFFLLLLTFWKIKSVFKIRIKKNIIRKIKLLFLILFPILFIYKDNLAKGFQFGLYRFSNFLSPFSTDTKDSRIDYFLFAIENTFNSLQSILFGHGIGSFGLSYNGVDIRDFPHNIFLETWFETGIIGVILLSSLLITPLFLKTKYILFKVSAIYLFLNYLKSGNLDGARLLFGIYGLLIFINYKDYDEN